MNQFLDGVENGDAQLVAELLETDPSLANATDTRMFWPQGYWTKVRNKEEGRPTPELRPRQELSRQSALHIAAENRQTEVARILIKCGSNVNAAGMAGKTVLQDAVDDTNGPVSVELVELLINSGADVNDRGPGGRAALHIAIQGMDDPDPTPKEVVELLLTAGADASAHTKRGLTPLAELLELRKCRERLALARMLIQEVAVLSDHPRSGPLVCLAARKSEPEVLNLLIEAGAEVNRSDKWGTPLHYAAGNGFSDNVEILLAAGADPCALDSEERTPLDWIRPQQLEALHILEEHVGRSTK